MQKFSVGKSKRLVRARSVETDLNLCNFKMEVYGTDYCLLCKEHRTFCRKSVKLIFKQTNILFKKSLNTIYCYGLICIGYDIETLKMV